MLLASCFYINPCSSGTFSSSSLLISWSQVLCSLLPYFSSFLTGGTGHMSVGWEVKGERSFPKPIMYWPVHVLCAFNARQVRNISMCSTKQKWKWWLCDFFAIMEKKLGEKDEDIFHRSEGNVIHRCLETLIVICYSQKIWKKNQTLFFLRSLCHWIIVALFYCKCLY